MQVDLVVMDCFANKVPEEQLTDGLRALLISLDPAKGDGPRPVTVRLLYASSHRRTLPGGLRRELLSRGLT